jgi:hypothetical protein
VHCYHSNTVAAAMLYIPLLLAQPIQLLLQLYVLLQLQLVLLLLVLLPLSKKLLLMLLLLLLLIPTGTGTAISMCPVQHVCGLLLIISTIPASSIVFTFPLKPA